MDQPVSSEPSRLVTPSPIPQEDFLTKIVEKVKEINARGILRSDEEILNHRLNFIWTTEKPEGKKGSATLWRNTRARRFYTGIQDADSHLFLAVILVIPPTECSKTSFDSILNRLTTFENYEPYRLSLTSAAKRYFESIAAEQGFARSRGYLNFLQALFPPDARKRKRVTSADESQSEKSADSEKLQNNHGVAIAQDRAMEHVSLEGFMEVFDKYMYDVIRRVNIENDGTTSLKAAVTLDFPLWGLVDCLMSLDACERNVEQLAMALFNVQVVSVRHTRYVILAGGVRLTPNPEVTLKGVLDEAIIRVFGSEIHEAITACRMRKKELEGGSRVTECVSMILTSSPDEGAIINLSLGLKEGAQIKKRLFT